MRNGQLLIGGRWVDTEEHDPVMNPYDQSKIGVVARATKAHADEAVTIGAGAHRRGTWPPPYERADILATASAGLRRGTDGLAECLALEAGKPLKAARQEIGRGADTLLLSSIEARKLTGEVVPTEATAAGRGKLGLTVVRPKGLVGAISPFNFPLNLVCHKLGPAFAAGCPVVLKPSSDTPFIALELATILLDAGWPGEFLSVLTGPSSEIGPVLTGRDEVAVISFTGSTEVGYAIAADCPKKTVLLELGSNTPVIVDTSADLDHAADRIAATAFAYAGQSCISAQRLYVHEHVEEPFMRKLLERVAELRTGDPLDERTDVGPLIRPGERDRVVSWIEEAVAGGARVRCGGAPNDDGTLPPTVLDRVGPHMQVSCNEVFGPVLAVQTVSSVAEAVELANASSYGLHAGIFTRDIDVAFTAAQSLVFGGVTINESPTVRLDQQPYGGVRESGNTREGPAWAVHDYVEETTILVQLP